MKGNEMWNVRSRKNGSTVGHGQYKDFCSAFCKAEIIATQKRIVINISKSGGSYKAVHPKGKGPKCTTS